MKNLLCQFIFLLTCSFIQSQTISSQGYGVQEEFKICWNGFGANYPVSFSFNPSCTSSSCVEHTYTWTSSEYDLGTAYSTSDKTIYFPNECKSGKIKCTHTWKVITGYSQDQNGHNIPIYESRSENKEVIVKVLNRPTVTLSGKSTIDCNLVKEETYTINELCSHETYTINWTIPSGWNFKNPSQQYGSAKSVVLITDNYSGGYISVNITASICITPGYPTPILVNRDIKTDLTIQDLNNTDFVAINSITILNTSSNPNKITKIKAGQVIKILNGTHLYSNSNTYTQLAIGSITSCSANKMAVARIEDTMQTDTTAKSIPINSAKGEKMQVNMYPNPASNFVDIDVANIESSQIEISIFDLLGKELKKIQATEIKDGSYKTNLDVSSFINGYYILNLKTEKENIQTKLQILK